MSDILKKYKAEGWIGPPKEDVYLAKDVDAFFARHMADRFTQLRLAFNAGALKYGTRVPTQQDFEKFLEELVIYGRTTNLSEKA